MLTAYVQLDPKLQEFVALGVTAAVSFLILQVANKYPWLGEYIGQHKVGVVTWLTGVIVQLIQTQLDRIPTTWDSVVILVMQLIVEVAIIFVGFALWNKAKVKGYKAIS